MPHDQRVCKPRTKPYPRPKTAVVHVVQIGNDGPRSRVHKPATEPCPNRRGSGPHGPGVIQMGRKRPSMHRLDHRHHVDHADPGQAIRHVTPLLGTQVHRVDHRHHMDHADPGSMWTLQLPARESRLHCVDLEHSAAAISRASPGLQRSQLPTGRPRRAPAEWRAPRGRPRRLPGGR
jgi:hypothetical protein